MAVQYPKRTCKNKACSSGQFIPKRPDQVFCDRQCKNYYHNEEKRKKASGELHREKILYHNYKRLKKLSQHSVYKVSVPENILLHEKVDLQVYTDKSINEKTNSPIAWSHTYGLERISKTDV